jgi:hypothetical protein
MLVASAVPVDISAIIFSTSLGARGVGIDVIPEVEGALERDGSISSAARSVATSVLNSNSEELLSRFSMPMHFEKQVEGCC